VRSKNMQASPSKLSHTHTHTLSKTEKAMCSKTMSKSGPEQLITLNYRQSTPSRKAGVAERNGERLVYDMGHIKNRGNGNMPLGKCREQSLPQQLEVLRRKVLLMVALCLCPSPHVHHEILSIMPLMSILRGTTLSYGVRGETWPHRLQLGGGLDTIASTSASGKGSSESGAGMPFLRSSCEEQQGMHTAIALVIATSMHSLCFWDEMKKL